MELLDDRADRTERAAERVADRDERAVDRAADRDERAADRAADREERAADRAADREERAAERATERAERAAEEARQLDVNLSFLAPLAKGVRQPMGLNFEAVNPGHQSHTITVAAAGLELPDGSPHWFGRDAGDRPFFPQRIIPGENTAIHFAGKDLEQLCHDLESRGLNGTVALIGFCEDAEHRLHKSAPLQFNIDNPLASVEHK